MTPKVSAIDLWQLHDHTTLQTFFMAGNVNFSGFWEKLRGRRQNRAQKRAFFESLWGDFLMISWRNIGHTATWCICKMTPKVSTTDLWQPHDHTTLQTFFIEGNWQKVGFWKIQRWKISWFLDALLKLSFYRILKVWVDLEKNWRVI